MMSMPQIMHFACDGCGSTLTDEECNRRRSTEQPFLSCCPERNMVWTVKSYKPRVWVRIKTEGDVPGAKTWDIRLIVQAAREIGYLVYMTPYTKPDDLQFALFTLFIHPTDARIEASAIRGEWYLFEIVEYLTNALRTHKQSLKPMEQQLEEMRASRGKRVISL